MYLETEQGGPAPVLPDILPMSVLKESESAVDNGSKFSTTYLSIIAFCSVCVTSFVKLLVELTLATPGLLLSSTASAMEFLATSFVEACATQRCFIRSELLTKDVDKGD